MGRSRHLNAAEIQAIVDDLFIGNKLASGGIRASDGAVMDLRNIRSPIMVFCSKGDNVAPAAAGTKMDFTISTRT